MNYPTKIEEQLSSFSDVERKAALTQLPESHAKELPSVGENVNMHYHSFFSYNAEGYSPSRIAWEARKHGLYAAGLCDFDVLDGLEEFINAGEILGLRTSVSMETRAYLKEYAAFDINSPGEQGVTYIMGAGFAKLPDEASIQGKELHEYKQRASNRNVDLITRINRRVGNIAIDYKNDVLPLTPAGAATERHIVTAYINKAKDVFSDEQKLVAFWSEILNKSIAETIDLLNNTPALEESVRSKLVKRGGLGYEPPSVNTFPLADDFIKWVASCDAIPMVAWLDGTTDGEKDGKALLECLQAKGAAALNIIPDRNWRISDPDLKAEKVANLDSMVQAAEQIGFPINIGTEMNKLGLPFYDDLGVEPLDRYKEIFLRGARIMTGHTVLLRYADFSYTSQKANSEFNNDISLKNNFFESVGALPPLRTAEAVRLKELGADKAFTHFKDLI